MRIFAISLLALAPLTGCVALHANIPEDVVRRHVAREDGIELAAICSLDGRQFSEGAIACVTTRLMACDSAGRWITQDGVCE